MDEETIVKAPVAERRGAWTTYGGNTWFCVSFAGGIETVSAALERIDEVGLVERDVTRQLFDKSLQAPDGRWALLVELVGSDWVHFASPEMLNLFHRDFNIGSKLAEQAGLRCLTTGHEDCSSATFVNVQDGKQQVLRFESTGEDFSGEEITPLSEIEDIEDWDGSIATTFQSDKHPDDWWRQFSDVKEVHQALVSGLGAYVPCIQALPSKTDAIELFACHPDAIEPANVRRIDLVVFGDPALAKPNQANGQLADGIRNGSVDEVRAAIAAGANLQIVKNTTRTPLGCAVDALRVKEPQRVEVLQALLEAGCDPNDGGNDEDSPLIQAVRKAKSLPTDSVKVAEMLLDAGADIAARTTNVFKGNATALHCALDEASMAMTHLLVGRGADIEAKDSAGRTPIERANASIESLRKHMGEELAGDAIRGYQKIIEYLAHVAEGGDPGALQAQINAEQAASDSKRRRMVVKGEEFKRKMQEFGKLVEEQNAQTRQLLENSILGQPDRISLERQNKISWQDPKRIEADTKKFEKAGFTQAGDFTIDGMPSIRIRGFVAPDKLLVAALGETTAGLTWWDVVRLFTDGSGVTATSSPIVDGMHNFEDPRFEKLYCADEPLRFFISQIGKVPANKDAIRIEAPEFATQFEKYYVADIAAKKSKCRSRGS